MGLAQAGDVADLHGGVQVLVAQPVAHIDAEIAHMAADVLVALDPFQGEIPDAQADHQIGAGRQVDVHPEVLVGPLGAQAHFPVPGLHAHLDVLRIVRVPTDVDLAIRGGAPQLVGSGREIHLQNRSGRDFLDQGAGVPGGGFLGAGRREAGGAGEEDRGDSTHGTLHWVAEEPTRGGSAGFRASPTEIGSSGTPGTAKPPEALGFRGFDLEPVEGFEPPTYGLRRC
jgi:hypothetical protein